ncbi:transcriptional regulator, TetR family [Alteribacillus persepolensis]|uniref:Transcriptional regulator, TetR family n=1 Tax=Alteribacillus persepolensis TaxID=568899 RepID=A0A1G8GTM5_9BACI|nr:TetR/AcrR family transcriptional regulator [Alteribacillus persepolensis]SDH97712.1 transcriptional regulator, TetR family [Alteribacillus persepolensis]
MKAGRKEIQRKRMWGYFLNAATEVIENEGMERVTIRKIADKAGFTSSTAYNYFKDLSHLKFFASMRFTKPYIEELPVYLEKGTNTLEKWLYSWECFCKHSFRQPQVYSVLFIDSLGGSPEEFLEHYYKIYPEELIGLPEQIKSFVMEHSFAKRSALYIENAVQEGLLAEKDVEYIADITLFIWKGMMSSFMNRRRDYTTDEAIEKTLAYVYESVIKVVPSSQQHHIVFQPTIKT